MKTRNDKWITVKPNGSGKTGTPVLLDKNGDVKAGMGGKHKGENISEVSGSGTTKKKSSAQPTKSKSADKVKVGDDAHKALDPGELDPTQKMMVQYYTGGGFVSINSTLRSGGELGFGDKRITDTLDSLMQKTDAPVQVYRGVTGEMAKKLKKGANFSDGGYTSTSTDISVSGGDFSKSGALMEITIPKGSPAVSVRKNAIKHDEHEIILGRGGTYTVTGEKMVEGRKVFLVEYSNG